MNKITADSIMRDEAHIWSLVYEHILLPDDAGICFFYKLLPSYPHWNCAYLWSANLREDRDFLSDVYQKYKDRDCTGHTYLPKPSRSAKFAVSTDHYFVSDTDFGVHSSDCLNIRETSDLMLFSQVVSDVFSMKESVVTDFEKQMQIIYSKTESHFYLAFDKQTNDVVGCWSTFAVPSGADFLMNCGLRNSYRGLGLSHELMRHSRRVCRNQLVTHTNSDLLAESVLPALGFRGVGTYELVKLADIKIG